MHYLQKTLKRMLVLIICFGSVQSQGQHKPNNTMENHQNDKVSLPMPAGLEYPNRVYFITFLKCLQV